MGRPIPVKRITNITKALATLHRLKLSARELEAQIIAHDADKLIIKSEKSSKRMVITKGTAELRERELARFLRDSAGYDLGAARATLDKWRRFWLSRQMDTKSVD